MKFEKEGNYALVEERFVKSPLNPGEDIWSALGRIGEYIDARTKSMGQVAALYTAYSDGGFIRIDYALFIHQDDFFPNEFDSIN